MLNYIYGVMESSKTAQLLIQGYNYTKAGYKVIYLKPATDTRSEDISSRIGISHPCYTYTTSQSLIDIINREITGIGTEEIRNLQELYDTGFQKLIDKYIDKLQTTTKERIKNLLEGSLEKSVIILVDECQFCTTEDIEFFKTLSEATGIDIYCYGLKTDYKTHLFPASQRLLEIADNITEISHICECGSKATTNALFKEGVLQTKGPTLHIGSTEYRPLCYACYKKYLGANKEEEKSLTT